MTSRKFKRIDDTKDIKAGEYLRISLINFDESKFLVEFIRALGHTNKHLCIYKNTGRDLVRRVTYGYYEKTVDDSGAAVLKLNRVYTGEIKHVTDMVGYPNGYSRLFPYSSKLLQAIPTLAREGKLYDMMGLMKEGQVIITAKKPRRGGGEFRLQGTFTGRIPFAGASHEI